MNKAPVITRKFVWAEWEETGIDGWLPKWLPDTSGFNPSSAQGVAHDVLEHGAREKGELHNEMKAFGRIIFVREENGYFVGKWGSIAENLGQEVFQIWRDARDSGNHHDTLDDGHADYTFEKMIEAMLASAAKERSGEGDCGSDEYYGPTDDEIRQCLHWFRIGYRDAARRYSWVGCGVCSLFNEVANQTKALGERHEYGDVLTVKVDLRRQDVSLAVKRLYN